METLVCIHCQARIDAHVAPADLEIFAASHGWLRIPLASLLISSKNGLSIGRNVRALLEGVAASPGQFGVTSSDGTRAHVMGYSPASADALRSAAAAGRWDARTVAPPGAGEFACSQSCVNSAVRREADDRGAFFIDGGRHPMKAPPAPPALPRVDVQPCRGGCGATLEHPAYAELTDEEREAKRVAMRVAHGWTREGYCSAAEALAARIHQIPVQVRAADVVAANQAAMQRERDVLAARRDDRAAVAPPRAVPKPTLRSDATTKARVR